MDLRNQCRFVEPFAGPGVQGNGPSRRPIPRDADGVIRAVRQSHFAPKEDSSELLRLPESDGTAGADGVLWKPLRVTDVASIVRRLTGRVGPLD
jgi:hypothetical protein